MKRKYNYLLEAKIKNKMKENEKIGQFNIFFFPIKQGGKKQGGQEGWQKLKGVIN